MAKTYSAIQTFTLSSTASLITFSNIPQNYTDLKLVSSVRGDTTNSDIGVTGAQTHYLRINNNTGNYHSSRYLYGNGASAASSSAGPETIWRAPGSTNASDTANTFSSSEIYIPNYTSSNYKSASFDMVTENNGTTALTFLSAFLYSVAEPITRLDILASSGNFVAGSTFTLYGIGSGARATGGTVTGSGNYVYHTFTSSGTFSPTEQIRNAEVLVIGGGGGGGGASNNTSAGGGAGGVVYSNLYPMNAGTTYSATVGSGGAAGASGSNSGSVGGNSSFGVITAYGGGAGVAPTNNGGSGGSGGGGVGTSSTGGSATIGSYTGASAIGYGNAGGGGANNGGGGGGGAGGVGGTGTAGVGANGGVGTSLFTNWGYATQTGQNVGGSYYYAGGGGGGTNTSPGTLGGLGGGGAGAYNNAAGVASTAGTANTGGGGGGNNSSYAAPGAAGGSGLVIIRYPIN